MNFINMVRSGSLKQQTALAACCVLGLFAMITFVLSVSHWHDDWVLAHQSIAPTKVAATDEKAQMIGALPKAHLFGMAVDNNGELPISSLQLRVTGIVKIEGEQGAASSKAYISIQGAPSKIYQVGDDLPYGVKVYQVESDAVILENDGHLEKLPLPREELEFKPRSTEDNN